MNEDTADPTKWQRFKIIIGGKKPVDDLEAEYGPDVWMFGVGGADCFFAGQVHSSYLADLKRQIQGQTTKTKQA